jgi:hypothetical protein
MFSREVRAAVFVKSGQLSRQARDRMLRKLPTSGLTQNTMVGNRTIASVAGVTGRAPLRPKLVEFFNCSRCRNAFMCAILIK